MIFASAGVLHHAGIKIPYCAFFAHDSGLRPKEAPWNMRIAMGLAAVLSVAIGCYPTALYELLPPGPDYQPYKLAHIVTQGQLLCFAVLAARCVRGEPSTHPGATGARAGRVLGKLSPWL